MKEAFDKGLAVGVQQIRDDSIYFIYKGESFSFHSYDVLPGIAKYNGAYYEAKVSKLRQLAREKK